MANMKLKKGDNVIVIAGKDKGKAGKILVVDRKKNRVIVEGVNMVTRHQKARGQGMPGGIIHKEAPIDASNVMLLCSKCNKPTRIAYKVLEDGTKVRYCKKCNATFEK